MKSSLAKIDYEELRALLTEAIFNHRWCLLEGYHAVGVALLKASGKSYEARTEEFALQLGQRAKTIHYCVELAKAYPRLESLPEGKTISWYKVCKLLPPYEKVKNEKRRETNSQKEAR